ncbi:OPT super [Blastocladiella emersonii ATCC 22665]|nr:OPT super [Blastocladiella emersonii ATCC 22665]
MTRANEKAAENGEAPTKKDSFVIDEDFTRIVNELAPTTDDIQLPSLTFRDWFLGTIFLILLGAVNTLMSFRTNAFGISSYFAVLLGYPLGKAMHAFLPSYRIDTNPGPFTVKEHVLITIFASTGAGGIYGIENIIVQKVFYKLDIGPLSSILFLLSTSVLGFGIANLCRRFLVRPAHMIWPSVLPSVALFSAFHASGKDTADNDESSPPRFSRLQVFGLSIGALAIWQLLPGFAANMLQYIPLLCFVAPASATDLQKLGSPRWGVGILSLSLDWSVIGGSNMAIPWWTACNLFASYVIFSWIAVPLAWKNKWFNEPVTKLRLNTSALMDKNGKRVSYNKVKPFYLSPLFAISYFGTMATFTSSISQMIVFHGKDIVRRFRSAKQDSDNDDIHCQLMDKYPETPEWWYSFCFVFTAIVATIVCHASGIDMPWGYTLLAMLVSIVGTIPIALVYALAGIGFGLNVVSEFVIGLLLPGKPVVMMAFKCLGVTVCSQCLTLLSDLKLGHYMKINPRHMFVAQLWSQVIAVFVVYFTTEYWINNPTHVEWILDNGESAGPGAPWGANGHNVYFNASIIWGAIGPLRFFFESVYSPIIVGGLVIGAVFPIILKLAQIFIGGRIPWKLIHPVLLFTVGGPGSNQASILSGFIVSFIFQFWIYRYHTGWWKKYNYVIASGADVGAAITTLIITGLVDNGLTFPEWFLNAAEGTENPAFV